MEMVYQERQAEQLGTDGHGQSLCQDAGKEMAQSFCHGLPQGHQPQSRGKRQLEPRIQDPPRMPGQQQDPGQAQESRTFRPMPVGVSPQGAQTQDDSTADRGPQPAEDPISGQEQPQEGKSRFPGDPEKGSGPGQ